MKHANDPDRRYIIQLPREILAPAAYSDRRHLEAEDLVFVLDVNEACKPVGPVNAFLGDGHLDGDKSAACW